MVINYSAAAIKTDGTLWTWGRDWEFGQQAQNDVIDRSSPTQVPGTTWSHLGAGIYHTMALKTDNTLWAWGQNNRGQLGVNDEAQRSSPIQIPGSWSSATATFYGGASSGVKTNGTLWTWGDNTYGVLGQNQATSVEISSPTQIGSGTDWSKVVQGGPRIMTAIKTDGTLWAIGGENQRGAAGINHEAMFSSPTQIPGTWKEIFPAGSGLVAGKA